MSGDVFGQTHTRSKMLRAGLYTSEIGKLNRAGISKSEIARRLQIGRILFAGFWGDLTSARCRPDSLARPVNPHDSEKYGTIGPIAFV